MRMVALAESKPKPLTATGLVATPLILSAPGLSQPGAKLHEEWVTMAEASTGGYYRGKYHSGGMQLGAICRIPEIARSSLTRAIAHPGQLRLSAFTTYVIL